ncbi:penicillin-binding protein 1B [Litorilituus lipolyticus]|uniref:Penicillin-binding protein 1B n=1 Tax=Litorilituus lipolyticus TaxID=2491017 RepID=A0A502KZH3_9GAMM|nr:penicillin-binding protein 1B [Litorilituus lipolyticus]TPH15043.1 penicillin-binding protein 1B [Litorilituus lipolyticus]
MPRKKTSTKTMQQPKVSWTKWLMTTLLKLCFAVLMSLVIYMIYLDAKVTKTFEGQRWQIPVQVYGKAEHLHFDAEINLPKLAASLLANGYQKVSEVKHAGEFAQSKSRLIIFQRAFEHQDGLVQAKTITIDQENNRVVHLYVNNERVQQVALEPLLLARIVANNQEDRVLIGLEEIPEQLLDTLLLIEDKHFYHHKGVSPFAILRAFYQNLRAGRTVQGGSTLTQQLVKNMYLTREKSLTRKVKEALMALILEFRYSKDQLLEAYVNEVYLGQHYANGIYGFGLAAKFYFGKPIQELNHAQIALLIAQIKGPSYYDPWRHSDRAKQRRDLILRLMFEQNFLSQDEFVLALESRLQIRKQRRFSQQKYPAYMQLVKHELNNVIPVELQKSGIRVYTGFSLRSQQLVEQTVTEQLPLLEKKHQQANLQSAMIVTDIASGEIKAIVGDRDTDFAGFNRALSAKRPIGSLIKPAIYLAALERYEEYNLATLLDDKAITLNSEKGQQWQPKNYDGQYRGQVPLAEALIKSLNVPTVNLGMSLGLSKIADSIHLLGYPKDITMRPSMLLGAMNMSPIEVNQLYLPIAGKGSYKEAHAITKVTSAQGETLWQYQDTVEQRFSTNASYLINFALNQVTKTGTAKSLTWRVKGAELAGKTGTSNDLRDSWFVGYDNNNLITTWLGKDDNKSTGLTGSSGALILFADFIKRNGVTSYQLSTPDSVAMTLFELKTGNAVKESCDGTVSYPAISAGIIISEQCLKVKKDNRSWLEKFFGD